MSDIVPGQRQLFDAEPSTQRFSPENLPTYEDVVLTAQQVEQAALEWPDKTPKSQLHYMKMRVLNKLRHEIVVDPISGRRAFGGAQPGTAGKEKKRVDESLVEAADERVQEIIDAAFSALDPKLPPEIRHKAAMNISRESREIRKLEIAEDELDRTSGDELEKLASQLLADKIRSGELALTAFDLTEADVVELDEE